MEYISCNSYPRSGKQWTERRVKLFLSRCVYPELKWDSQQLQDKMESKHTIFRHLGFNNTTEVSSPQEGFFNYLLRFTSPTAYFILRHACAVLSSAYFHTRLYWNSGPPMSIDEYVKGDYGVNKYCAYLNGIQDHFLHKRQCRFLHYEDAFTVDWVKKNIPLLANMPEFDFSQQDAEYVHTHSSITKIATTRNKNLSVEEAIQDLLNPRTAEGIRYGTPDSYKKTLKPSTITFVADYLKEHCRLEAYTDYYFKQ